MKIQLIKPEDLTHPDIMDLAAQGRVAVLVYDTADHVTSLTDEIMKYIQCCKVKLNRRVNMLLVRMYIKEVVEAEYEMCFTCMTSDSKRNKFVCQLVGSLLEHGAFCGEASGLADCMKLKQCHHDNRRRYINDGRHKQCFIDKFRSVDSAIPNDPSDLCNVKQNK